MISLEIVTAIAIDLLLRLKFCCHDPHYHTFKATYYQLSERQKITDSGN
jgi:hypothetical protein